MITVEMDMLLQKLVKEQGVDFTISLLKREARSLTAVRDFENQKRRKK